MRKNRRERGEELYTQTLVPEAGIPMSTAVSRMPVIPPAADLILPLPTSGDGQGCPAQVQVAVSSDRGRYRSGVVDLVLTAWVTSRGQDKP